MTAKVDTFACTQPCSNCPYRTDAPLQFWHKSEFKKIIDMEHDILDSGWLCHKDNGSICIGYLMKQDENRFPSIMLSISLSNNNVTREYLDQLHSPSPLYKNVRAMVKANYPELLKKHNMTKQQFKQYCHRLNLTCKYSGNKRTMYVTGQNASKLLRHSIEAANCAFKVSAK